MSISKTTTIIFSLIFSSTVFSQQKAGVMEDCRAVLHEISNEWRNDSLGANGFRLAQAQRLSICDSSILYPDFLLNIIGASNEVWTTESETWYIYYLSGKILLSGQKRIEYINFIVTGPKNYVVEISRGQIVR